MLSSPTVRKTIESKATVGPVITPSPSPELPKMASNVVY